MLTSITRREFVRSATVAGLGLGLATVPGVSKAKVPVKGKRIGIIGLDTSHSIAFTKTLNNPEVSADYKGYRVVAAYPHGSADIESSVKRIAPNTEEIKTYGVKIVDSIKKLLKESDFILLETNDGRLHLEQALEVIKAGKPMFIDKPMTASLKDAMAIFEAAAARKVPVFSSSSLRFMKNAQAVAAKEYGAVLGADTYSPAELEKTHPDLFWYGIHGVETLYTVMGTGCQTVSRTSTPDTDVVVGRWSDDRIGTFRGTRNGKYDLGGIAFCEKGNVQLGPFLGYDPLLVKIIEFFETGKAPVSPSETLEILAFMEAADESKAQHGKAVSVSDMFERAKQS